MHIFLCYLLIFVLALCSTGSYKLSTKDDFPQDLEGLEKEIAKQQMIIRGATVEPKTIHLSNQELAFHWGQLAELYLSRHESFLKRDLQHALSAANFAIRTSLTLSQQMDKKDLFGFLVCRASILTKMNRIEESLQDLDRALALADSMTEDYWKRSTRSWALLQKGYALIVGSNDPMTAMEHFNESLSLNPCANMNGEIHSKLILAIEENDYYDAEEWISLAARLLDDFGPLGISICTNFLRSNPDNKEVVIMEDVKRIVSRVNIHWMLFSIFDAAGDRNKAWAHLRYARDLDFTRMGNYFETHLNESKRHTQDILRQYHPGFWEKRPFGSKSRLPVYIVGFFRSGSSLLEKMLSQHRSIGTLGETNTLGAHLIEMKADAKKISNKWSNKKKMATEEAVLKNHTQAYLKDIKQLYADDSGSKLIARLIDKMLWNYKNLGIINSMLPNSYIIHIVRDPLDTLLSCYKNRFMGAANAWTLADDTLVREYVQYLQVMQHFNNVLPKGRIIEITYAQLILDTKTTMRYLVEKLGLEWDDSVLRESGRKNTVTYTASLLQVKKAIYRSSLGGWRLYRSQISEMLKQMQKYKNVFHSMHQQQLANMAANSCRIVDNQMICITCPSTPWYDLSLIDLQSTCSIDKEPTRTRDGRRFFETNWLLDPEFDYEYKKDLS